MNSSQPLETFDQEVVNYHIESFEAIPAQALVLALEDQNTQINTVLGHLNSVYRALSDGSETSLHPLRVGFLGHLNRQTSFSKQPFVKMIPVDSSGIEAFRQITQRALERKYEHGETKPVIIVADENLNANESPFPSHFRRGHKFLEYILNTIEEVNNPIHIIAHSANQGKKLIDSLSIDQPAIIEALANRMLQIHEVGKDTTNMNVIFGGESPLVEKIIEILRVQEA